VLFPLILLGKNRKYTDIVASDRSLPNFIELFQMLGTFLLVVIGWILFRANTICEATSYISGMINKSLFSVPWLMTRDFYIPLFLFIVLMFIVEWKNRSKDSSFGSGICKKSWVNIAFYYVLIAVIIYFQPAEDVQFIYFQF